MGAPVREHTGERVQKPPERACAAGAGGVARNYADAPVVVIVGRLIPPLSEREFTAISNDHVAWSELCAPLGALHRRGNPSSARRAVRFEGRCDDVKIKIYSWLQRLNHNFELIVNSIPAS